MKERFNFSACFIHFVVPTSETENPVVWVPQLIPNFASYYSGARVREISPPIFNTAKLNELLKPSLLPGRCTSFEATGNFTILIELHSKIAPTSISISHADNRLSLQPDSNLSAPKIFNLWGVTKWACKNIPPKTEMKLLIVLLVEFFLILMSRKTQNSTDHCRTMSKSTRSSKRIV